MNEPVFKSANFCCRINISFLPSSACQSDLHLTSIRLCVAPYSYLCSRRSLIPSASGVSIMDNGPLGVGFLMSAAATAELFLWLSFSCKYWSMTSTLALMVRLILRHTNLSRFPTALIVIFAEARASGPAVRSRPKRHMKRLR